MPRIDIIEYAGYKVYFSTESREFQVDDTEGEVRFHNPELAKLETSIDNAIKRDAKASASKLFPIEVILRKYGMTYLGRITSLTSDNEAWFIYANPEPNTRERQKVSITGYGYDFFKPTPKNLATIESVSKLEVQIAGIRKEIEALRRNMEEPIDLTKIQEQLNG